MNEELEKKIGKIVLSIFNGFLKILSIFVILPFVFITLFIILWVPTFLVAFVCLGMERFTGIDTSVFRYNLSGPIKGLGWVFEKTSIDLFGFLLKTQTGHVLLIMTILVVSFFEYQKKTRA